MQLICIFVFAYGKDRFSHDSAQLQPNVNKTQLIHTENVQEHDSNLLINQCMHFKMYTFYLNRAQMLINLTEKKTLF